MDARSLVVAIDQGTTSSRCILFDRSGGRSPATSWSTPRSRPDRAGSSTTPRRSSSASWTCVRVALAEAGADARALAAVGISNQRETTVVWDRATGRPVAPRDRLAGHPDRGGRPRGWPRPIRSARTGSGR